MMKRMTRMAALLMALAMLLTMTACSKEPENNTPVVTQAPAAANAAEPAADYVMATVNGTPVTYGEYTSYLATMVSYYANYGY